MGLFSNYEVTAAIILNDIWKKIRIVKKWMILYASLKLHACSFITMQLQNNGKVNFNHFPSLFQCHQIKYVISMERNPAILHTITLCNRCVTVKLKTKYKENFFSWHSYVDGYLSEQTVLSIKIAVTKLHAIAFLMGSIQSRNDHRSTNEG